MAEMIPPNFGKECVSPGERDLFRRLESDPGTDGWIVLHSYFLSNHKTQISSEIDFVIIIPGQGVLCLEVKGHSVISREQGVWLYGEARQPDLRGPFKQASSAMHSLRLEIAKIRKDLSQIVFWSAVVFPRVNCDEKSPEWESWQLIDHKRYRSRPISEILLGVMRSARKHLDTKNTPWFHINAGDPYPEQCKTLATLLRGNFELHQSAKSRADELVSEINEFTAEQYKYLDMMQHNRRIVFLGPAGTGKTSLALESARRSIARGEKTLLLCFNRYLHAWLETQIEPDRNLKISTIHKYLTDLTGARVVREDQWAVELPSIALEQILLDDTQIGIWENVIVDEAQDIVANSHYVDILDAICMRGLAGGKWQMFGDFIGQDINQGRGEDALEAINTRAPNHSVVRLSVNCRNTPQIGTVAQAIGKLSPGYSEFRRSESEFRPEIRYWEAFEAQLQLLTSDLEMLLKKWSPGDIVLLSGLSSSSAAMALKADPKWKDRLVAFEGSNRTNKIRYSSIQAFKGLEAPVVLVTDITADHLNRHSLLYVGSSRALDHLYLYLDSRSKSQFLKQMSEFI